MIEKIKLYMKYRVKSNAAEITTTAVLLWISFAIVVSLGVGRTFHTSFSKKGSEMTECIDKSKTTFGKAEEQNKNQACEPKRK